jgi:TP901-1 family phage major tail protein
MSAHAGKKMVLKIGNGATPVESFLVVGGLRQTQLLINQTLADASDVASGGWRKLLSGTGIKRMTLRSEGVFEDSAAEEILRAYSFAGTATNFQLLFGNGDRVDGAFMVASYEQRGEVREPQQFALILENAGPISFIAG